MTDVGEYFRGKLGAPSGPRAAGLRFGNEAQQLTWEMLHEEIGAGFFLDGFLYLFGEGMEQLAGCVAAWRFLVPALPRALVVGYNAFGTLLVVKDHAAQPIRAGVLDPARVIWWDPPDLDFTGLVGSWLPDGRIPHFLEREAYDAWRAGGGRLLKPGEMLALETPAALGGTFAPENLRIRDLTAWYQASGPVYAKTIKAAGKAPRRGKPK